MPSAKPSRPAYATTNPGLIDLLKLIAIAIPNAPKNPISSAPCPRFALHASAPTTTKIANKNPVFATTSSIVMRPVRIDEAAGAL